MDKELLQLLETGKKQINTINGLLEQLRQYHESLQALELAKRQLELTRQLCKVQCNPWAGVSFPDFQAVLDTLALDVETNRHPDG